MYAHHLRIKCLQRPEEGAGLAVMSYNVGVWELKPALREESVFLSAEPPLQPQI